MTIRLLGTGAADGVPALFGDDPVSRYARVARGRELRTRASALVDGHLKIDLPPETTSQVVRHGLDAREWSAILFTHSHEDHLAVSELQYALHPFTEMEILLATVYGNRTVLAKIRARYPAWPMELCETRAFEPRDLGEYLVTPLPANHSENEECHTLLIERGGVRLLYATDTGVPPEAWFAFLAERRLDGLVLECTDGFLNTPYTGHLDVDDMLRVVERLRAQGTLDDRSQVATTHHAAAGGATYAALHERLAPHGVTAGYDGLELVLP